MIPKSEYITVPDCPYQVITWDLVKRYHTKYDISRFNSFMTGQTSMVMEDGKSGIYVHDYEKWLKQGKKRVQDPDWD